MSVKMVELNSNDMMTIIELMAEMLVDCKKDPRKLELFPADSTELVIRIVVMVVDHKEEVVKAGKLAKSTVEKAAKP